MNGRSKMDEGPHFLTSKQMQRPEFEPNNTDLVKSSALSNDCWFYKTVKIGELGEFKLLKNKMSSGKILQKTVTVPSKPEQIQLVRQAKFFKAINSSCLVKLLDFSSEQNKAYCSENYTVSLFMEGFELSLHDFLTRRWNKNFVLKQESLERLLLDLSTGLADLHEAGLGMGFLNPKLISVVVANDEILGAKIVPPVGLTEPQVDAMKRGLISQQEMYYSPEVYDNAKKIFNDEIESDFDMLKQDSFALGLILLRAGLMESVKDLYSQLEFDSSLLRQLLQEFKDTYSDDGMNIVLAIEKLLDLNSKSRLLPSEVLRNFQNASARRTGHGRRDTDLQLHSHNQYQSSHQNNYPTQITQSSPDSSAVKLFHSTLDSPGRDRAQYLGATNEKVPSTNDKTSYGYLSSIERLLATQRANFDSTVRNEHHRKLAQSNKSNARVYSPILLTSLTERQIERIINPSNNRNLSNCKKQDQGVHPESTNYKNKQVQPDNKPSQMKATVPVHHRRTNSAVTPSPLERFRQLMSSSSKVRERQSKKLNVARIETSPPPSAKRFTPLPVSARLPTPPQVSARVVVSPVPVSSRMVTPPPKIVNQITRQSPVREISSTKKIAVPTVDPPLHRVASMKLPSHRRSRTEMFEGKPGQILNASTLKNLSGLKYIPQTSSKSVAPQPEEYFPKEKSVNVSFKLQLPEPECSKSRELSPIRTARNIPVPPCTLSKEFQLRTSVIVRKYVDEFNMESARIRSKSGSVGIRRETQQVTPCTSHRALPPVVNTCVKPANKTWNIMSFFGSGEDIADAPLTFHDYSSNHYSDCRPPLQVNYQSTRDTQNDYEGFGTVDTNRSRQPHVDLNLHTVMSRGSVEEETKSKDDQIRNFSNDKKENKSQTGLLERTRNYSSSQTLQEGSREKKQLQNYMSEEGSSVSNFRKVFTKTPPRAIYKPLVSKSRNNSKEKSEEKTLDKTWGHSRQAPGPSRLWDHATGSRDESHHHFSCVVPAPGDQTPDLIATNARNSMAIAEEKHAFCTQAPTRKQSYRPDDRSVETVPKEKSADKTFDIESRSDISSITATQTQQKAGDVGRRKNIKSSVFRQLKASQITIPKNKKNMPQPLSTPSFSGAQNSNQIAGWSLIPEEVLETYESAESRAKNPTEQLADENKTIPDSGQTPFQAYYTDEPVKLNFQRKKYKYDKKVPRDEFYDSADDGEDEASKPDHKGHYKRAESKVMDEEVLKSLNPQLKIIKKLPSQVSIGRQASSRVEADIQPPLNSKSDETERDLARIRKELRERKTLYDMMKESRDSMAGEAHLSESAIQRKLAELAEYFDKGKLLLTKTTLLIWKK